jgi:hypothetical protein
MLDSTLVRSLGPGERITEPGFYAIPLDQHHSQPCDGVSVTSGILRKMEIHSPADVWAFHQLNPNRYERADSAALRTGRAAAAIIEGGMEEFERHFRVLPANKPNRPTAAQLQAFREGRATEAGLRSIQFWEEVEADPRDVLTVADYELLVEMALVLSKDPAAQAALGGIPEITMAWRDETTDLWCLARPDQVSFSGMLSDYKKVAPGGSPFNHRLCDRRILDGGYDMQMAFAAEGFERLTGNRPSQVGLIMQSSTPPYHVVLREIHEEDLNIGAFRNRYALTRFRECLDMGHWPGPGDDVGAFQRPDWHREMMLERMNTAGTAP